MNVVPVVPPTGDLNDRVVEDAPVVAVPSRRGGRSYKRPSWWGDYDTTRRVVSGKVKGRRRKEEETIRNIMYISLYFIIHGSCVIILYCAVRIYII